jgi:hypothetical protein
MTVYAVTSLTRPDPPRLAGRPAPRLLGVEALHHVRDVTFARTPRRSATVSAQV